MVLISRNVWVIQISRKKRAGILYRREKKKNTYLNIQRKINDTENNNRLHYTIMNNINGSKMEVKFIQRKRSKICGKGQTVNE